MQQAHLRKANLKGANLLFADLRLVDLKEANLQQVDLREAKLQQANLEGAEWDEKTIMPDGTQWTSNSDLRRFTNPNHPRFWRSDDTSSTPNMAE